MKNGVFLLQTKHAPKSVSVSINHCFARLATKTQFFLHPSVCREKVFLDLDAVGGVQKKQLHGDCSRGCFLATLRLVTMHALLGETLFSTLSFFSRSSFCSIMQCPLPFIKRACLGSLQKTVTGQKATLKRNYFHGETPIKLSL